MVPSAAFGVAGGLFAFGTGSLRKDLLAGFISTVIAAALLYPLDTMKTRMQVPCLPQCFVLQGEGAFVFPFTFPPLSKVGSTSSN